MMPGSANRKGCSRNYPQGGGNFFLLLHPQDMRKGTSAYPQIGIPAAPTTLEYPRPWTNLTLLSGLEWSRNAPERRSGSLFEDWNVPFCENER